MNGSVVDSVRQSQKKREKIRANLEQASLSPIRSEKCKDEQLTQSEIWLEYSLDDGGYFLNFRWRWPQIKKSDSLRALTSIACQRGRGGKPEPEQWETVAVSRARRDRIWISPAFFGPEPEGDRHPVYGHNFPGGDAIRRQKIELRIEIDIGLETVHREITLGLPANLEQAVSKRRDQAGGYLDCPGSEAESAAIEQAEKQGRVDPRQWYSDSI